MSVSFASKNDLSNANLSQGKSTWVRPSDWLTMPTVLPTENKVVILYAVFDTDNETPTITMTTSNNSNYTIDWGDGTVVTNNAVGTNVTHTYNYATIDNATLTSRGYKQVLITITPTNAGVTFTNSIIFGSATTNVWNALDMVISFTNNGTIAYTISIFPLCESVNIVNGTIVGTFQFQNYYALRNLSKLTLAVGTTSLTFMFSSCYSLEYLPEINFNGCTISNTQGMFNYCYNLKSVYKFQVSSVTTTATMFSNCYSLELIPNFQFGGVITTTASMFSGCSKLKQIDATFASNSVLTTTVSMYSGCSQLQSVPTLTVTGTSLVNTSSMYNNCYLLRSVPILNTSYVTNASIMHNNCLVLKEIPFYDLQRCTNAYNFIGGCVGITTVQSLNLGALNGGAVNGIYQFFNGCSGLVTIPTITIPSTATSYTSTFPTSGNLKKMRMTGLRYTFSLANNKLSAAELDIIFGNLVATTGQIITITGNPGAATCTRSIATAKSWTVTG